MSATQQKNNTTMLVPDLVVYHNPCTDGICGAWAVKTYYKDIESQHPIVYQGTNPNFNNAGYLDAAKIAGKTVFFVDIMPKRDMLLRVCQSAAHVLVLDHHKTNESIVSEIVKSADGKPANLEIVFDMSKSGCQIAWSYFYPEIEAPWFINYVADRDLWTWKLPNSKLVNSGLFSLGYLATFDSITKLYTEYTTGEQVTALLDNTIIPHASAIESYETKILSTATINAAQARFTAPDGKSYDVWLGTTTPTLRSDLGNYLMKKPLKSGAMPLLSVTWQYEFSKGEWWISLRSDDKSPIDCTKIAEQFGGGGHPNAAGFTIYAPKTLNDYFRAI